RMLELRFDNVIFRAGLAISRAQARQLVAHGHFTVNGRLVDIPSYQLKVGDRIEVRQSHAKLDLFKMAAANRSAQTPEWQSVALAKLTGSITDLPRRDQMPLDLNEQLVVEYYSR